MTNAEKFKEVFGVDVDFSACPRSECTDCPLTNYMGPGCSYKWWNLEFKEVKHVS